METRTQFRWLFICTGVVILFFAAVYAQEPVFLGYGSDPQWSPSGKYVAIKTDSGFDVVVTDSVRLRSHLDVQPPWLYHWVNDDTLALYFKEYTKAAKPIESVRVGINALLSFDGRLVEVSRDTAFSPRDYLSPWQRLPSGEVGVFKIENGIRVAYFKMLGTNLVPAIADTAGALSCRDSLGRLFSGFEITPSPQCSRAFGQRASDRSTLILDSNGKMLVDLGISPSRLAQNRMRYLVFPKWSYSGTFLTLQEEIEDGHTTFTNDILLVNVSNGNVIRVTNLADCGATDVDWSPNHDQFVYVEGCSHKVMLYGVGE